MSRYTSGLLKVLEEQLAEARDFALDAPSISGPEFSYEHLLLAVSTIRQAQLTLDEIKTRVVNLERGELLPTAGKSPDDAEPSDVHASDAAQADEIRGMVATLASKRHGGSS